MDPKLMRMYSDILNEMGSRGVDPNRPPTRGAGRSRYNQVPAAKPSGGALPSQTDPAASARMQNAMRTNQQITARSKAQSGAAALPAKPAADSMAARGKVDAMAGSQATANQTQSSSMTGQDTRTANARAATDAPPAQGFAGGAPAPAAPAASASPSGGGAAAAFGKTALANAPGGATSPAASATSAPPAAGSPFTNPTVEPTMQRVEFNPPEVKGIDLINPDSTQAATQPKGVFSTPTMGAGNKDSGQSQAALPAKQFGGGYDPSKVDYAATSGVVKTPEPTQGPAVTSGSGDVIKTGSGGVLRSRTPDEIAKTGPMGIQMKEEEELEEVVESDEGLQEMLRLSGISLTEQSLRQQDMERRMAATRQAASGLQPGQQQSSVGPSGASMTVTKSGPAASATVALKPATTPAAATTTTPAPAASKPAVQSQPGGFSAMGRGSVDFEESLEETEEPEELAEMMRLSGLPIMEKAVSKQQQKFMGMVHAMQKGEKVKGASAELKKTAKSMSKSDAKDFAKTKHKDLPQKVTEGLHMMLDEEGHTLSHIVNRFKHEVRKFIEGDFMPENLYDALYDYYLDRGEMPYGVAKAREGDPYSWVADRFYDDVMRDLGNDMNETVQQPVMDDTLNELAHLAGLSESSVNECGDMGMDHEDRFNVSTNMSSDGTKSVNISAQGDRADELLQMLKMAGMRPHDDHSVAMSEPEVIMIGGNDEMMDEERETQYANTPEEEYETIDTIIRQGNDLNREKRQYADRPRLGDNPMAEAVSLEEQFEQLYNSVLLKKNTVEEGSIKGGDRPGDLTGTWSADPPAKGKPDVPPPVPMDPVSDPSGKFPGEKKSTKLPGTKK